jgi:hypothetical protein
MSLGRISDYLILTTDPVLNGDHVCLELVPSFSIGSQSALTVCWVAILVAVCTQTHLLKKRHPNNEGIFLQYMPQMMIAYPALKVVSTLSILVNMVVCAYF